MLPPGLDSPHEVAQYYDGLYRHLIDTGQAYPFVYPWGAVGGFLALLTILLDNRQSRFRRYAVYAAYIFMCGFHIRCLARYRARNAAAAFGLGLVAAFSILWIGAVGVTIYGDDCRRIQRPGPEQEAVKLGRSRQNHVDRTSNGQTNARLRLAKSTVDEGSSPDSAKSSPALYWQAFPAHSFSERLDWLADAFTSFRAVGWTWQGSGVPPPPIWVEAALKGDTDDAERAVSTRISRTGVRRFSDRRELLRHGLKSLAIGYIVLDGVKTLGIHDPYMWGYMDALPPSFLPEVVRQSFMLTRIYRLSVSLTAIYSALWTIFKLGPVFFCGILGPEMIGLRGEAWMNPADMFGSFDSVLDYGLGGWWGAWWHQTFRFVFEQPAVCLLARLQIEKSSAAGKLISVFTAFFLSGCLHASGSYTQLGDTRPILGPMRFFLLQACAITLQTLAAKRLKSFGVSQRLPRSALRLANFILVHVWLYHTAPLLCDDFSRGGIWLFEPVPISIFRGIGLGPIGGGEWWCWADVAAWRTGEHWWDTGIVF